MKFVVSSQNLLKQLKLISGVISANTVLPILEDFLFKIEKGKLTIFATDLETSMSTELEVESKENGLVAIPAKLLTDTLSNLPDQPITVDINDDTFAVELTTNNGKFKMNGENGEDFPKIPVAEDVKDLSINSVVLSDIISKALFAVSNDELRPAMTGVYFNFEKDGATFIATDAHRLVRYKHKSTSLKEATNFIVPKKAMQLLKNAVANEETSVKISFNSSNAFFSFNQVNLICRLIDAKYPDINPVIPVDNPNHLTVNTKDLQNSLRRISIYANRTTHQVKLAINGNELNISAEDIDFSNEAKERLTCEYKGENMEIGFNAKFLAEMLNAVDTATINMELSTPSRAGLIIPEKNEEDKDSDILMLIMPVMLNS